MIKKNTMLLILALACFFINSCSESLQPEDCMNYDYSDCNTLEPELGALHVKLTINAENPYIPVSIYEGNAEDSLMVLSDTVMSAQSSYLLVPDKYYTVVAKYKSGNNIIYAFDGDRVKKIQEVICDSICWSVDEGNVNVELK